MTPSYNQGAFIEETIKSVLDQGYANLEYIIMDGGSSDETVSIIERYQDRIAYWVSAKDAGQSDAIERGFARATGDILAWVNSDDALAPGALAAVAAAFADGTTDLVAGVINIKQDGKLVYHHRTGCRAGALALEQLLDLEGEWMTGRFFYQPEVFFSRGIYERAGGMIDRKLHYSMDYDLWLRCARAGARIKPIDYELANFRMHADQKTSTVAAFLPELKGHASATRAAVGLPPLAPLPQPRPQTRRLRIGMVNDYGFRYGAGRAHGRLAECLAAANYEVMVYAFFEGIGAEKPCHFEMAVEAMRGAAVDVVLLGNLHGAFPEGVDLRPMAALAPVLIATHDFFYFTGRCPYPLGCDEYLFTCPPSCPTREQYPVIPFEDIPLAHARKLENLALDNVHVLANSAYMEDSVRRLLAIKQPDGSAAGRVHRISLPVPETDFRPADRAAARTALGLAADDVLVLTASSSVTDRRKGFRHAIEACRLVADRRIRLFALGWIAPELQLEGVTYLGHVDGDVNLARCYIAADVLVSASADETFGQVFVEAAMCGCPSIGYAVGGVREAIVPGETGWLVERNDIAALADTLRQLVGEDDAGREAMRWRTHIHATSRWGAASFLSTANDIFRSIVQKGDVEIPTGVQYGSILGQPIQYLKDIGIIFGAGFDSLEGPYPDHDINYRFRWMTAPEARLDLHVPKAKAALLTLVLANIHVPQTVALSREGETLARFDLAAEPWSIHHEVTLALDLPAGDTTLSLAAGRCFETPDRNLHLAVVAATLEPTEAADGLRGLTRRPQARASEAPAANVPVRAEPSVAPPQRSMQPNLRLHAGFHPVEGPHVDMGIPMRLAWLTRAEGMLSVAVAADDDVLGLDIHLPCAQQIVVTMAGERYVFAALNPDAWDHPTCLVVPLGNGPEGWREVTIECAHHFVDDADRALRLAILGAQTYRGRPSGKTDNYGRPGMERAVRTAIDYAGASRG